MTNDRAHQNIIAILQGDALRMDALRAVAQLRLPDGCIGAGFVRDAKVQGAKTLELNLEPSQGSHFFDDARYGAATELVPEWVEGLLDS